MIDTTDHLEGVMITSYEDSLMMARVVCRNVLTCDECIQCM